MRWTFRQTWDQMKKWKKISGQILSFLGPKKKGKKKGIIFLLQIQFGGGGGRERERKKKLKN